MCKSQCSFPYQGMKIRLQLKILEISLSDCLFSFQLWTATFIQKCDGSMCRCPIEVMVISREELSAQPAVMGVPPVLGYEI